MANGNNTQAEQVRQTVGVTDSAEVKARIDALSAEAWTETVEDIAQWAKVKNKFSKLSGGKLGLEKDPAEARLEIRNRVRVRLGYPELDKYGQEIESKNCRAKSGNVPIRGW